MALIQCPDCGKPVSNNAPTCPQCGRRIKPLWNPWTGIFRLPKFLGGPQLDPRDGVTSQQGDTKKVQFEVIGIDKLGRRQVLTVIGTDKEEALFEVAQKGIDVKGIREVGEVAQPPLLRFRVYGLDQSGTDKCVIVHAPNRGEVFQLAVKEGLRVVTDIELYPAKG